MTPDVQNKNARHSCELIEQRASAQKKLATWKKRERRLGLLSISFLLVFGICFWLGCFYWIVWTFFDQSRCAHYLLQWKFWCITKEWVMHAPKILYSEMFWYKFLPPWIQFYCSYSNWTLNFAWGIAPSLSLSSPLGLLAFLAWKDLEGKDPSPLHRFLLETEKQASCIKDGEELDCETQKPNTRCPVQRL